MVCREKPSPGGWYCKDCDYQLWNMLCGVSDLLDDLMVTECRLDRIGDGNSGGKSAQIPLPWNERAAKARVHLVETMTFWSHAVGGDSLDADVVDWLALHMDDVRVHASAGAIYRDVESAIRRARNTVDRPPERVFAGPCNTGMCIADLYARPGKPTVRCKCGAEHDVAARREWMLSEIHEQAADAGLMSSILTSLGHKIHSSTIRRYGAEGLLTVVSRDSKGTPRYRIGAVLNIFYAKKDRQGRKKIPPKG